MDLVEREAPLAELTSPSTPSTSGASPTANPFYVREVVTAPGRTVPATVADAVLASESAS